MSDNNPRIILHLDMDYFFAQCGEKNAPGDKRQACGDMRILGEL